MHVNCQSIFKKHDQLSKLYKNCEVICCSKNWLTSKLYDGLIDIPGKTIFQLDREGNNVKKSGVWYLDNRLSTHCKINSDKSKYSPDFELLCPNITKPGLRFMTIICIYRPPCGKIKPCIDYLKNLFTCTRNELWILGDFNVDFLDRNNDDLTKFLPLFKIFGLKQLINDIARPNRKLKVVVALIG